MCGAALILTFLCKSLIDARRAVWHRAGQVIQRRGNMTTLRLKRPLAAWRLREWFGRPGITALLHQEARIMRTQRYINRTAFRGLPVIAGRVEG